jgi:long-chain acyl-CoA synthetase
MGLGSSEACGIAHDPMPPAPRRRGSVGIATDNEIRIRDAGGRDLAAGETGEIVVRGPLVFNGYLYDEAATAAAFDDGWLKTGDVVELDAATGEVAIVDRKKAILITSGGKNITPSLIENALKESLYISESILLGDGRHFVSALIQIDLDTVGQWAQERGLAYTTYESLAGLAEVRTLVEADVKRVNDRFSRVENIRRFVILKKQLDHDDGELTATMKVRRGVIEKKFASEIEQLYGRAKEAA